MGRPRGRKAGTKQDVRLPAGVEQLVQVQHLVDVAELGVRLVRFETCTWLRGRTGNPQVSAGEGDGEGQQADKERKRISEQHHPKKGRRERKKRGDAKGGKRQRGEPTGSWRCRCGRELGARSKDDTFAAFEQHLVHLP